jgi:hypothetical protein
MENIFIVTPGNGMPEANTKSQHMAYKTLAQAIGFAIFIADATVHTTADATLGETSGAT